MDFGYWVVVERGRIASMHRRLPTVTALSLSLLVIATAGPVGSEARHAPTAQAAAVNVDAVGPKVGDRVPPFTLKDQTGTERTLDSIMGAKGAMLVFFRSADW